MLYTNMQKKLGKSDVVDVLNYVNLTNGLYKNSPVKVLKGGFL
jgi:hypothetical protein